MTSCNRLPKWMTDSKTSTSKPRLQPLARPPHSEHHTHRLGDPRSRREPWGDQPHSAHGGAHGGEAMCLTELMEPIEESTFSIGPEEKGSGMHTTEFLPGLRDPSGDQALASYVKPFLNQYSSSDVHMSAPSSPDHDPYLGSENLIQQCQEEVGGDCTRGRHEIILDGNAGPNTVTVLFFLEAIQPRSR